MQISRGGAQALVPAALVVAGLMLTGCNDDKRLAGPAPVSPSASSPASPTSPAAGPAAPGSSAPGARPSSPAPPPSSPSAGTGGRDSSKRGDDVEDLPRPHKAKGTVVTLRGQVSQGVEPGCLVLSTSGQGHYTLVGATGGSRAALAPGAHVLVTGRVNKNGFSTCMQGPLLEVLSARRT
jgi:hypothetical protein